MGERRAPFVVPLLGYISSRWIEPGETFEMGAAREAFEESKGILGDALALWLAICEPSCSRRCGSIVLLSLGLSLSSHNVLV